MPNEYITILKINMAEENKGQESRLKNIDETKNYFIEGVKRNELMRKKDNKIHTILNYIGYLLILASVVTLLDLFQFLLLLL